MSSNKKIKKTHDVKEIVKQLNDYISTEPFPLVSDFISSYYIISKSYFYELAGRDGIDNKRLADAIKRLEQKAETHIIRASARGTMPYSLGIFLLKQPRHGYTDRQEIQTDTSISINFSIPRPALPGQVVDITPKSLPKKQQKKGKKP